MRVGLQNLFLPVCELVYNICRVSKFAQPSELKQIKTISGCENLEPKVMLEKLDGYLCLQSLNEKNLKCKA